LVEGRARGRTSPGRRGSSCCAVPGHSHARADSVVGALDPGRAREDGTGANFTEARPSSSTTVRSAYVALRLAGDRVGLCAPAPRRAVIQKLRWCRAHSVFTRIWLALFDLWRWARAARGPAGVIFLPSFVPPTSTTSPAGSQERGALTVVSRRTGRFTGWDLGHRRAPGGSPAWGGPAALAPAGHDSRRLEPVCPVLRCTSAIRSSFLRQAPMGGRA